MFTEWSCSVVAKCSPYLHCDSTNDTVRKLSEETLIQELTYAGHLSVPIVIINITQPNNTNLARLINSKLSNLSGGTVPQVCKLTTVNIIRLALYDCYLVFSFNHQIHLSNLLENLRFNKFKINIRNTKAKILC